MDNANAIRRSWDVLLLGGPSGVGKTRASYPLARLFDVGITEVDDLHITLERLTTPEQQPVLHYWRANPNAQHLSAEQIVELHIAVSRLLGPAVEAVIVNHLETSTPIVLEGDYLLPEILARGTGGRTKAVFLFEPDEAQILKNLSLREPEGTVQPKRARVSWLYGQWLQAECGRYGVSALPARPWSTLVDRIGDAVA